MNYNEEESTEENSYVEKPKKSKELKFIVPSLQDYVTDPDGTRVMRKDHQMLRQYIGVNLTRREINKIKKQEKKKRIREKKRNQK